MEFEAIYSQGTAEYREDGLITNWPFFGVIDGVSSPYSPNNPPILFNGMTGGEKIKKVILETFYNANPTSRLKDVILKANRKIREFQIAKGIPIERSDLLAAATFAFVKIGKEIKIIQGGDCFVVWVTDSKIDVTKNQTYLASHHSKIANLMEKYEGNKEKMWDEFYPYLYNLRQRDYNQQIKTGFAVLNGQPWISRFWKEIKISSQDLNLLLLFTDGFVPAEERGNEKELAEKVIALYQKKGLKSILERTRRIEEQRKESSHIDHEEATAIAINFGKQKTLSV